MALGWANMLYYTQGFQFMGIYSIMIQKVRWELRQWEGPQRKATFQMGTLGSAEAEGLTKGQPLLFFLNAMVS
ncbi:hypothetical protein P7K49_002295, partial [Saguinus oedipus]